MPHLFLPFTTDISLIEIPQKFTYPFNYTPHKLSEIAASELQLYIQNQTEWEYDFGLVKDNSSGIGKMFGVLVCQNQFGDLGQLWAFSGKLAGSNHWSKFVPTVFDNLKEEGFYKKGEQIVTSYNNKIEVLKKDRSYLRLLKEKKQQEAQFLKEVTVQKEKIKKLKKQRDQKRIEAKQQLSESDFLKLNYLLTEQSKKENIKLKKITKHWKVLICQTEANILVYDTQINELKRLRKEKSAHLQQQLFKEYFFYNINQKTKSLGEIFDNNPPAGAGECCAPKLLHYAFEHQLKPIAMAEFWWGKSPNSAIRKHQFFYPSCRSKCEPILLKHMLNGMAIDENPLETELTEKKDIEIIFEDAWMLVINKPNNLLSVPGKRVKDSVYFRIKKRYPNATGPLVVHRLDRATSGLMIIAKNLDTYIALQKQFTARTVKKKYVALLDGVFTQPPKGNINLPLRVNLDHRPQQLVCYTHGKNAQTQYQISAVHNHKTHIIFIPITGRTHQLRVHSAHPLGLNTPIVGDDLYGKMADRLYLHAQWIQFEHPIHKKAIEFEVKADF